MGDRVLLVSNRFGSHDSVTTLSKNSTQLAVLVPTVARIDKQSGGSGKVTTLVRSMPDTWEDLDGDRQKGPEEPSKVFDVAVAVDGPEGEGAYRAIVVGDVNLLSDPAVSVMEGNFVFIADAMRWLVGDEDIVGETQSEEDVKIQHTRDEDVLWFWVTIFGVPALVLAFGILFVQFRRRK